MQRRILVGCATIGAAVWRDKRPGQLLGVLLAAMLAFLITTGACAASTPALTLTPTALSFASQATGTTSAPQQATATNSGSAPPFFNSVQIHGADTLDFTLADDQCSGVTLAPDRKSVV